MDEPIDHNDGAWTARAKLAFALFAIVGAFFLIAEHRAHVFPFLPWLILAACPLMHMFMHGGHGHHHRRGDRKPPGAGSGEPTATYPENLGGGTVAGKEDGHQRQGDRP